jgi:serine/threonine-protein kinase
LPATYTRWVPVCPVFCGGNYLYLDRKPNNFHELHALILNEAPTPIREMAPHVSRSLAARVNTALTRDPMQRYASATELDADLGRLAAPDRDWQPTAPHQGHERCWESVGSATPNIRVCVISSPGVKRVDVEVARLTTNNRIRRLCRTGVSRSALGEILRSVFESLGN